MIFGKHSCQSEPGNVGVINKAQCYMLWWRKPEKHCYKICYVSHKHQTREERNARQQSVKIKFYFYLPEDMATIEVVKYWRKVGETAIYLNFTSVGISWLGQLLVGFLSPRTYNTFVVKKLKYNFQSYVLS